MGYETLRKHRITYKDYAPRTFREAFDRAKERKEITTHGCGFNGTSPNVNMSDIFSEIIRVSGRVSTGYNSDVLYDIETINAVLHKAADHVRLGENFVDMVVIGIRKNGADSTDAVLQNLESTLDLMTGFTSAERHYHTIMAVEVTATATEPAPNGHTKLSCPRFDVTLRDITNDVYRLDPRDIKNETKRQMLMKLARPRRKPKAFSPDEIETKLRLFYEVYLKHWLYRSELTLGQVAGWLSEHGTLKGVTGRDYDEPHDYEDFKKTALLSEEYMGDVLSGRNLFGEYLAVMDTLYPEE